MMPPPTSSGEIRVGRIVHAKRYTEIVSTLVKFGFADVVRALHLTPYVRAGRRLLGYPALGLAGFLVAGFLGIGLALGVLRSGRL